jgi:hypothetical protein
MKKVLFTAFLCFAVFTCSYGQTKQESIRELFHLMKDDSTTTKIIKTMMPMFVKGMGQETDSLEKVKSQEKIKAVMESVKKIITKIREDKVNLYVKYFTQQEIDDMIAFYKSPAGRKYVSIRPEITKEIVLKVMKEYLPEMEKEKKAKQEKKEDTK